jgi:hypothetical protein
MYHGLLQTGQKLSRGLVHPLHCPGRPVFVRMVERRQGALALFDKRPGELHVLRKSQNISGIFFGRSGRRRRRFGRSRGRRRPRPRPVLPPLLLPRTGRGAENLAEGLSKRVDQGVLLSREESIGLLDE